MASTPSPQQRELATRLRILREELVLKQAELATILSREKSVQAPTVSTWESHSKPVRPPTTRIAAYARLKATASRDGGAALVPLSELSEDERAVHDVELAALTELYDAAEQPIEQQVAVAAAGLWGFLDDGPLSIICPAAPPSAQGPLADPADPNYTETHSFADVDALLDIYGHLRMEVAGRFPVTYHPADDYRIEDLSGHLVILGGIGWNELSKLLQPSLTRLPVRQLEVPDLQTGEIFEAVKGDTAQRFYPEWSKENDKVLYRDVGYIARTRNPYNPHRTLTICNGIHSRGVLGAVRSLTDIRFRRENEAFLAETFPGGEFAILIKVPVIQGRAIGVSLSDPEAVLFSWPEPSS